MIDAETTRCFLTFASAGLELIGLAFVVVEIGQARRNARAVLEGKTGVDLKLRVGAAIDFSYAIKSDETPTVEKRLERLEGAQRNQSRKIAKEVEALRSELIQDIDQVRNETLKAAAARDSALRDMMALQGGGGIRLRVIGAVCIAVGIALAVPANLVG